jgi:hypothetical protein
VINVDKVLPELHGMPADITRFSTGDPVPVSWNAPSASDADSGPGPVRCSPPSGTLFGLAAGAPATTTPVTCSVQDMAGNGATASFTVTVTRLEVTFDSPVDKAPVMNVAKLGRVIPVKATVTVGGVAHSGPSSVPVSIGMSRVTCGTTTTDGLESYAAAGSSNTGNLFRWDATAGRWAYNLDTGAAGGTANSCYRVAVYYGGSVAGGVASGGTLAGSFLLQTKR